VPSTYKVAPGHGVRKHKKNIDLTPTHAHRYDKELQPDYKVEQQNQEQLVRKIQQKILEN
jgi:hypothetical protein